MHTIDNYKKIYTSVQGTNKKSIPLKRKTWYRVDIRQKPSRAGKVKCEMITLKKGFFHLKEYKIQFLKLPWSQKCLYINYFLTNFPRFRL